MDVSTQLPSPAVPSLWSPCLPQSPILYSDTNAGEGTSLPPASSAPSNRSPMLPMTSHSCLSNLGSGGEVTRSPESLRRSRRHRQTVPELWSPCRAAPPSSAEHTDAAQQQFPMNP